MRTFRQAMQSTRNGKGANLRPMNPRFLQQVDRLRPMIKTCWEVLLRAEPPLNPLGNPDTLVYMMDCTLDEVFAYAHTAGPRQWLSRHPFLCAPIAETCPCGRNPLFRYYESGEQALLAIAGRAAMEFADFVPAEREEQLAELRLTFAYFAQRELQNFCDLCRCPCARSRTSPAARPATGTDGGAAAPALSRRPRWRKRRAAQRAR